MNDKKNWCIKFYSQNKEIETKCSRVYYGITEDEIKWVLRGWVAGLHEKYKHPIGKYYEI